MTLRVSGSIVNEEDAADNENTDSRRDNETKTASDPRVLAAEIRVELAVFRVTPLVLLVLLCELFRVARDVLGVDARGLGPGVDVLACCRVETSVEWAETR